MTNPATPNSMDVQIKPQDEVVASSQVEPALPLNGGVLEDGQPQRISLEPELKSNESPIGASVDQLGGGEPKVEDPKPTKVEWLYSNTVGPSVGGYPTDSYEVLHALNNGNVNDAFTWAKNLEDAFGASGAVDVSDPDLL